MSYVDYPNPTPVQPRSSRRVVATIGLVIGGLGALLGLFTPAFVFFVPAVFGVVTIVLAIIGYDAQVRAWISLVFAAICLAEAAYGFVHLDKAAHELNALATNFPSTSTSTGSRIVDLKFGTTYTGTTLSVGLSKPAAYSPSEYAFTQQQTGRAVAFTITVADTDRTQPFPAMDLDYQATSGNTQDQSIEDSANNVGTAMATILPGHTLAWQIAFSVPKNATDITVAVSSMGGDKTVVFSGPLG
jgi:hypothetical protein